MLFVAVTGGRERAAGSRYFATHPTVDVEKHRGRYQSRHVPAVAYPARGEVQGLKESDLGDDGRKVAAHAGVEVQADEEPQRNLFIRSDQYSFIRAGVPALAFKFGYEPGSPEEKLHKDWLKNRYHAPSDDLNQPVDKSAAEFNRLILTLAETVANAGCASTVEVG